MNTPQCRSDKLYLIRRELELMERVERLQRSVKALDKHIKSIDFDAPAIQRSEVDMKNHFFKP